MESQKNFLEIARANFQKWNEALKTKDASKVAELYSKDSSFLPTLNGEFKAGQEEAEGYFEHFLLKNPSGKVVEEKVQPLGDSYVHSGLYDFEVGPADKREIVEARFTYVWQDINKNGQWKIIHHHSSVKPVIHQN